MPELCSPHLSPAAVDQCTHVGPCANGGTCSVVGSTLTCTCPGTWTGERCQTGNGSARGGWRWGGPRLCPRDRPSLPFSLQLCPPRSGCRRPRGRWAWTCSLPPRCRPDTPREHRTAWRAASAPGPLSPAPDPSWPGRAGEGKQKGVQHRTRPAPSACGRRPLRTDAAWERPAASRPPWGHRPGQQGPLPGEAPGWSRTAALRVHGCPQRLPSLPPAPRGSGPRPAPPQPRRPGARRVPRRERCRPATARSRQPRPARTPGGWSAAWRPGPASCRGLTPGLTSRGAPQERRGGRGWPSPKRRTRRGWTAPRPRAPGPRRGSRPSRRPAPRPRLRQTDRRPGAATSLGPRRQCREPPAWLCRPRRRARP